MIIQGRRLQWTECTMTCFAACQLLSWALTNELPRIEIATMVAFAYLKLDDMVVGTSWAHQVASGFHWIGAILAVEV